MRNLMESKKRYPLFVGGSGKESGSFRPRSSSPPRRFAPAAFRPRSFRPWSFRPLVDSPLVDSPQSEKSTYFVEIYVNS